MARVADADGLPSWQDLGLNSAKKAAFDWQEQRQAGRWNEAAWVGPQDGWVREVHGLFGVAAELVIVCIEAEVEKHLHNEGLKAYKADDPSCAWASRALRFFAEGQGNYLVVFGHAVANIALRTLALHRGWDSAVLQELQLEDAEFVPRSDARRAWASLNTEASRQLRRAARRLGPAAIEMSVCLSELTAAGSWWELNELRGGQYHRWRAESPGVAATDRGQPTSWERLTAGEVVSFPGPDYPFTDGQAVVDELLQLTRSALDQVADWMPRFHEAWSAAYHEAADSHRRSAGAGDSPACVSTRPHREAPP